MAPPLTRNVGQTRRGVTRAVVCAAILASTLFFLRAPGASALVNTAKLTLSSPTIFPGQTVTATLAVTEDGTTPYGVQATFSSTGDEHIACVNWCNTDAN